MLFSINKKTGFITTSKKVVIYRFGMPFYSRTRTKKFLKFNLPAGDYNLISGEISKMRSPIIYKKIKLPEPNKITKFSNNIKVYFVTNKNKCSVDLSGPSPIFYFDNSFKNYPRFVITWICGHEIGHYFYRGEGHFSEKKCDIFSSNLMLDLGYNPSQINAAIQMALSDNKLSELRKKHVYSHLLKQYK